MATNGKKHKPEYLFHLCFLKREKTIEKPNKKKSISYKKLYLHVIAEFIGIKIIIFLKVLDRKEIIIKLHVNCNMCLAYKLQVVDHFQKFYNYYKIIYFF